MRHSYQFLLKSQEIGLLLLLLHGAIVNKGTCQESTYDHCNATVAGPLNENRHRLILRKANSTTPAEIACRIICHDANPERKYTAHLQLGILYEMKRAQDKTFFINRNYSEPNTYYIHSKNTSYCHRDSNETYLVWYIHLFSQSPILLATCSVTYKYDPTGDASQICHGSGVAVIKSDELLVTDGPGVYTTTEHADTDITGNPIISSCNETPTFKVTVTLLVLAGLMLFLENAVFIAVGIWFKASKRKVKILKIHPISSNLKVD